MKDSYRGMFREGEFDRPFFVSVVPPSGRKPWPIKTEPAGRTYLEGQPLTVEFSYPVHYVPAGRRRPVASWVRDKAPVLFKTAETSQVRTACVIRRGEDVTEVVHFGGELWWSLPGRPPIERFAAALAAGEHAAVGLLDQGCVTTHQSASSETELSIKDLVWNGRESRIAALGRGAQGILVSEGKVFVRDGAPLSILWNGYRNQSITSIGISPVIVELASSRRNPAFDDVTNELIFGRTFEVGDRSGIAAFATEMGIRFAEKDTIEIMLPDLLRQDPVKVQLEAMLGKLSRLLAIRRPGTEGGRKEIARKVRYLRDSGHVDGSANDRARVLKNFAEWVSGVEEWKKKLRVERLFSLDAIKRIEGECGRRRLPSPFSEPQFSEEDEEAIGRHFGSAL
ncbi:MAG: hypothetical protein QHD01_16840 [Bradyrhizobium sp.]|uniref:hypothetical protein n=1 Tax=Bradyrhizobium sp. TaxID=376 RepID=UPI0029AD378B|nr:hypothetical protein [Bradyrhizobium sp.]MDX3968252.1 hypothetical protein [Bradyrhizobium sp.]